jgi:hypothetical protein
MDPMILIGFETSHYLECLDVLSTRSAKPNFREQEMEAIVSVVA